ncbi:DUF1152 domain-containing protein [Streptomyces qinzhouensis]|uniref:DUF1152 domain-containing protein n=1 Tax=Streptomyces qinzhouensis TaxID=2599401 RepID=A0A5B8JT85_9ACTN|nr:DUF1152 domain-containing protein [Streptomyces qinzhouensis]
MIVAAGGGGDAVAAAMLDTALYGTQHPAVVLTYAWDRLLVDPVPGPRTPADFTALGRMAPRVPVITADTEPVPPAGSTLPRLARELPQTFALTDPQHGVQGITVQLTELVEQLRPESIDLLDVGGDILAHGDEPTLRSPLADALTLAARHRLNTPVRLLVAGPGLDGELPAETLHPLLGPAVAAFTPEHTAAVDSVLEWHPSEATAMLAATARGIRGLCEARDAGLPIPLTDESPTVHEVDMDAAFTRNILAHAITATTTLTAAEALSREICGFSEIDYERDKATRLPTTPLKPLDPESTLTRVAAYEHKARARGATHTTFRHLTETLSLPGTQRDTLKSLLLTHHPEQYTPPLWHIPPTTKRR